MKIKSFWQKNPLSAGSFVFGMPDRTNNCIKYSIFENLRFTRLDYSVILSSGFLT